MTNPIHLLAPKVRTCRGLFRSLYLPKKYHIKSGYFHRSSVKDFDAAVADEKYQKEVYEYALDKARGFACKTVLDLGAGSGYKLMHYFKEYEKIGIETPATVKHLSATYPENIWLNCDTVDYSQLQADIIICADVIEHIYDPDQLILNIKKIKDWKMLLISTPDRDVRRGKSDYGPSPNPYHYREWNMKEFYAYIRQYFAIEKHFLSSRERATQLVVCTR